MTEARQLVKAGCKKVFRDVYVSGAKTDRLQVRRLIDTLGSGDVLRATRPDRMVRPTRDLLNTLTAIIDYKTGFRTRHDAWAGTVSNGRLMLAALDGLTEYERKLIQTRTAEGTERAEPCGVKLGRKPKLAAPQQRGAFERPKSGELVRDLARTYTVCNSTISWPIA